MVENSRYLSIVYQYLPNYYIHWNQSNNGGYLYGLQNVNH